MTKTDRARIIDKFMDGCHSWEISEELDLPLKAVRETISLACAYEDRLYASHTNPHSTGSQYYVPKDRIQQIVNAVWA